MIDIKELRIGSHVLYRGERVEVWSIEKECGCYDITVYNKAKKYEDNMFHSSKDPYLINTGIERLDPIPITEELLKELGFEEMPPQNEGWNYGIEKVLTKEFDSPIEEDYFISLAQYEGGLYQLQVLGTIAYVRNLNELESYVYLTTEQELI